MMMTRREFLKRLGLLGAAALVGGYEFSAFLSARELTKGGRSVSRTTGAPRYPVPSTCLMCPARCGIIGYLEDERLVKLEGNPKDPENRGGICAKGLAGPQYLYNPDRVLYPLKRVGPRGSGRWERISWEEAYTEVASRLAELKGKEGQLVLAKDFRAGPLAERFARAWGAVILDEDSLYRANRAVALSSLWGAEEAVGDVAHAKYILNFGANPYETHRHFLPLVRRVIEARMNGAKLVTFDPRTSNTAGRSDEWFPIKPGTDGLVALAMANLILQLGLYDKEFISSWLNYPLEELAAHLRQYTPEMAASVSGIKESHLRRIAIEFATNRPATVITGGGASEHLNGTQNERAIFLLPALTGNIEVRGGLCLPRSFKFAEPTPKPPPAKSPLIQEALSSIIKGRLRVGLLLTCSANPAFTSPATRLIVNLLRDERLVPYHVAITSYMSETAVLADLVLPAATYLESFGLHSPPAYGMVPLIKLQQPMVRPRGEAVPPGEIFIELAKRMGGQVERYFGFGTVESYLQTIISGMEGLTGAGGLAHLKDSGVWFEPAAKPVYRSHERAGFPTPSGRIEVYAQGLEEAQALPSYLPIPGLLELEEGEFILVTFQSNVQNHEATANCMWLAEIEHRNPVWINKEVAKSLGIREGERVRVTSSFGSIEVEARLGNGLHPQVVAIAGSLGHWAFGRIAQAERFQSSDPNTRLIWWEGGGVHPYPLIPIASDPVGRGQAWLDTKVGLSRISGGRG